IGNTPLVFLQRMSPNPRVRIAAKLESQNPGGSVKDRVALAMIEAAESSGELTPEKTVIEATSGNTGIGLAMVCACKGYQLLLIMPESASEERKRIMSAYGAELLLTPGHLSTDGAIEEAYRLAREEPERYLLVDQFNNPASIQAHYQSTAVEVWEQTQGQVTHTVSALGTSGTAMGLAQRLKEYSTQIQVVAVEPYAGHKIQGLKNMQASYPPGIYKKRLLDRILHVDDEQAFALCRELAQKEGLLAGMSSGAALGGALQLARELEQGYVVVIFPDSGERYLSTPLFLPPAKQGLALYNVQSRQLEFPSPNKSPLGIFCPGPSPEAPADLEDWRRLVFTDVLARYLGRKELPSKTVAGVADFEDQALEQARSRNLELQEFSRSFLQRLSSLGKSLNLHQDFNFVPASGLQKHMLDLCQKLLDKGMAYEKLRSVYYDVVRDADYGRLLHADLGKLSLGKTVDLEDYAKDHPQDFTLLKRASLQDLKRGEFIKAKWGNVRPSWYLQMAAAARECGPGLEVVLAGRQHSFPHLDNLRAIWGRTAQAEPGIWMLVQSLEAKQEEGPSDLEDLLQSGVPPQALRMWLLSASYKKPLVYSSQSLKMWVQNWHRLQNLAAALSLVQTPGEVQKDTEQALFDLKKGQSENLEQDLGLYRFWPVLFSFCKRLNKQLVQSRLSQKEAAMALEQLKELDTVLGVIDWQQLPLPEGSWPAEIRELVQSRQKARAEKDFARADQLRGRIRDLGFELQDAPEGVRLFRH
ncbi:MAG: cysteine synthase, partial [Thermodesulfobacteriota bacterium]